MNDYSKIENGLRNQTLVIVEGDLEKYVMFKTLLKCFPEIPIQMQNVHIYQNDIYDLYHAIEIEYGNMWYEEGLDINIPYLISAKFNIVPALEKKNFVNIIMIFDYEHHDNFYSDEKILKMQKYFNRVEDQGFLYINYPMIESLYHYKSFPDEEYIHRSVPVTCNPGKKYKEMVKNESAIIDYISLYHRLIDIVKCKVELPEEVIDNFVAEFLSFSDTDKINDEIEIFLNKTNLSPKEKNNFKFTISKLLTEQQYMKKKISYWEEMRIYFKTIFEDNVTKADYIQENGEDNAGTLKEKYLNINWENVLNRQNEMSRDCENGIIMILCTCITFLGEYKFCWI